MPDNPYLQWPVFRRSVVAAFQRSLTPRIEADNEGWNRRQLDERRSELGITV